MSDVVETLADETPRLVMGLGLAVMFVAGAAGFEVVSTLGPALLVAGPLPGGPSGTCCSRTATTTPECTWRAGDYAGPMSDDEDDDGNNALVKRVLWDPQGNLRHDRALDAIRGRRSHYGSLVPRLVATVLGGGAFGLVAGYLDHGTVAGMLEGAGMFAVAGAMFGLIWIMDRLESYYEADEELAVEELRARYARGELDLETFQQQVDRVYEEGPEWVFEDEGDDGDPSDDVDGAVGVAEEGREDGESATTQRGEDPMAILRRRFARGELSEAEYRSRVAALEETMDDDAPAPTDDAVAEVEGAGE